MPRVTITVPEKTAQPYRFQLDREVVSMGRGSENDIPIDSGSVSVNHAEMHRIRGGYELRDVGSTNGIKLDGERHEVIPLRNGALVTIGDVAFDFLLSDEELEVLFGEREINLPQVSNDRVEAAEPAAVRSIDTRSGIGAGAVILFLILAAVAFFGGLYIRHQKDTGGNLIEAIQAKPAPGSPAGQ